MKIQKSLLFTVHLLLFPVILSVASPGFGQVVSDVPENRRNSRFLDDPPIVSMRPSLSISGFSNEGSGSLGLQQILNAAMESTGSAEYETLANILNKSKEGFSLNPGIDQVEVTTNILQYLAFEALVSVVLEQNGIPADESDQTYGLNVRTHSEVIEELTDALLKLAENDKLVRKLPGENPFTDYLDALRSYNNTARAIDLYLAVENAYQYYNLDEDPLLDEKEKITLMSRFLDDIEILYNNGLQRVYELGGSSATEDELEAGNRPLKGYFALGYSSMSAQSGENSELEKLEAYTETAILRASENAGEGGRMNYWMYQTGNGQQFWGEGPYYLDLALKDAIIFWNAVRNNRELDPSLDPFYNDWFLNPVRWLADLSTPDGSAPPLDDGNKRPIQSAGLLRWTGDFGDEETGRIFNSLHHKITSYHDQTKTEDQFYLVEAAIPFTENGSSETGSVTDPEQPHIISRFTDSRNRQHYIALTGEKGGSISTGEGHEQPDQLQLLYYMDQYSFLVDPGYDSGNPQINSTWNGYLFTNTMQYNASETRTAMDFVTYQNEGGLESPYASLVLQRKVSDHQDADLLYREPAPSVEMLSGRVQLNFQNPLPAQSDYNRTVLAIKGSKPYLIDLNEIRAVTGRNDFVMRYYGNSNETDTQNGWFFWDRSVEAFTSPNNRLFLYTIPLFGDYTEENETIEIQEYENLNASGDKQPYPIVRKSYYSTEKTDRFTTASILKIGESVPQFEPAWVSDTQTLSYLIHQIDVETTDLFVFAKDTIDRKRTFTVDTEPISGLDFTIPSNKTVGFSRLRRSGNTWIQDDDYVVNLQLVTAPAPPANLSVSIENRGSGPAAILTWDPPKEGEIRFYEIWKQVRKRGDQAEEPAGLIATTETNRYADFSVTELPPGEYELRWFVRAVNSDSLSSEPSNWTDWVFIDRSETPDEFKLFNPFPNPMQQSGHIRFQLSQRAEISIQLFDLMGRPVKTIAKDEVDAGIYSREWNSNGMASGIYILQLKAESETGVSFKKSVKVSVIQ